MNILKRIKCFRYLVYTYLVLLMITGFFQIGLGTYFLYGHLGYELVIENDFWAPATVLLCLGPLTLLLSWFGWTSTQKKKRVLLGLFSFCLVIVIFVQIVICGWALGLRNKLPSSITTPIDISFAEFVEQDMKSNELHLWNRLQSELKCCGIDSFHDYRRDKAGVPWSCIKTCVQTDINNDSSCGSVYKQGCLPVYTKVVRDRLFNTALVSVVSALIQSVGLFCVIQLTLLLGRIPKTDELPTITVRSKNRNMQEMLPLSNKHNKESAKTAAQQSLLMQSRTT